MWRLIGALGGILLSAILSTWLLQLAHVDMSSPYATAQGALSGVYIGFFWAKIFKLW